MICKNGNYMMYNRARKLEWFNDCYKTPNILIYFILIFFFVLVLKILEEDAGAEALYFQVLFQGVPARGHIWSPRWNIISQRSIWVGWPKSRQSPLLHFPCPYRIHLNVIRRIIVVRGRCQTSRSVEQTFRWIKMFGEQVQGWLDKQ